MPKPAAPKPPENPYAAFDSALPDDLPPDLDAPPPFEFTPETAATPGEGTGGSGPGPLPSPQPAADLPPDPSTSRFRADADPHLVRAFDLLEQITVAQLLMPLARRMWLQCHELVQEIAPRVLK